MARANIEARRPFEANWSTADCSAWASSVASFLTAMPTATQPCTRARRTPWQTAFALAAAALLERKPRPTDADIDEAMTNICRCGTYQRVRAAIHAAAAELRGAK